MTKDPPERRERFEATALPFLQALYGYAIRLTRNGERARDLVQETYLRAYRTFDNFRPGTNCKAWPMLLPRRLSGSRSTRCGEPDAPQPARFAVLL